MVRLLILFCLVDNNITGSADLEDDDPREVQQREVKRARQDTGHASGNIKAKKLVAGITGRSDETAMPIS